jgi:hypothetical protein
MITSQATVYKNVRSLSIFWIVAYVEIVENAGNAI